MPDLYRQNTNVFLDLQEANHDIPERMLTCSSVRVL
jgi:hypothetical protein